LTVASIFCCWGAAKVDAGDDVSSLSAQGLKAYQGGDYQKALDLFQQVVIIIQNSLGASFESFFPKPPKGFTAGEIEDSSVAGVAGGASHRATSLICKYTRTSDNAVVTVSITNMPISVQAIRQSMQMFLDPQMKAMLANSPDAPSVEERDGWTLMTQPDGSVDAATEELMLSIQSNQVGKEVLAQFLGGVDLLGLAAAGK
jgi:hypothetical protein